MLAGARLYVCPQVAYLPVQEEAKHGPDGDYPTQNSEFLQGRLNHRPNDIRSNEELKSQEQVMADFVARPAQVRALTPTLPMSGRCRPHDRSKAKEQTSENDGYRQYTNSQGNESHDVREYVHRPNARAGPLGCQYSNCSDLLPEKRAMDNGQSTAMGRVGGAALSMRKLR